jgi:hypothetical protein
VVLSTGSRRKKPRGAYRDAAQVRKGLAMPEQRNMRAGRRTIEVTSSLVRLVKLGIKDDLYAQSIR